MEGILKSEPEDSPQDIINFQSYIDAVKKEQIKWELFVQLMLDLSNSMNRQKLLISILLNELKDYIHKENRQTSQDVENIEKENDDDDSLKNFMKKTSVINFKQQSNEESLIQEESSMIQDSLVQESKTENNYDDIIEDEGSIDLLSHFTKVKCDSWS